MVFLFLPAAKPSGPRAVRVVVVVVVVGGGSSLSERRLTFYSFFLRLHKVTSGWDPQQSTSFLDFSTTLSPTQVFEQSLFLFSPDKEKHVLPYDDAFAIRVTIDLGGIFRGGGRGRRGEGGAGNREEEMYKKALERIGKRMEGGVGIGYM